jgi:hypothetical protein
LVGREQRVATLITAESIIVGFLVAFGSGVNETLVFWIERGKPIFGTVLAGLLISGLALTAFRSIYLLYKSIDISDVCDVQHSDERYIAGYYLFLIVIGGSGVYVLMNGYSILHYAMTGGNLPVPCESLWISIATSLLVAWVLLVVFKPLELAEWIRRTRSKYGDHVFAGFVFLLIVCMIGVETIVLPLSLLLGWPPYVWWILFVLATIATAIVLMLIPTKRFKK